MIKTVICTPTILKPYPEYLESLEDSAKLMDELGIEHATVFEIGCPYISGARATMLGKALEYGADNIVFIDHDLSWHPIDLVRLIQAPHDVVAGLYRFKKDEVAYMGVLETDDTHRPKTQGQYMLANRVPAGFLKVTTNAIKTFLSAYPDLRIGDNGNVDLFNHGAIDGTWFGEDYAFSKRWRELGREIHVIPDLSLTHHTHESAYAGNFYEFMIRQPGGSHHG